MPSGLISVMPQACSTSTPYSISNASIIAGGAAEPPITAYFTVESLSLLACRYCSSANQMVGTPAAKVTLSFSNSS